MAGYRCIALVRPTKIKRGRGTRRQTTKQKFLNHSPRKSAIWKSIGAWQRSMWTRFRRSRPKRPDWSGNRSGWCSRPAQNIQVFQLKCQKIDFKISFINHWVGLTSAPPSMASHFSSNGMLMSLVNFPAGMGHSHGRSGGKFGQMRPGKLLMAAHTGISLS